MLLKNYHYNQLGFVCKWEYQFEMKTKIPLRLRLGTLKDCNEMEYGK